jgi:hypothetical protein
LSSAPAEVAALCRVHAAIGENASVAPTKLWTIGLRSAIRAL